MRVEAGLVDKVVIVTGAGRGIGQATALALGRAGARLIVNGIDAGALDDTVAALTAMGAPHVRIAGSVADWAVAEALTVRAVEQFGRLDGLVNNAGLHYQAMPWEEEEAQVRSTVEANVLGPMFCGIHAIRVMREQGSGSIVNISSGAMLGSDARGIYSATKAAVATLSLNWARDLAGTGIRVNALAPHAATRMTEGEPIPGPEKIAPVIGHLLSDRSDEVSGRFFRYNGHELSEITPARRGEIQIPLDARSLDDAAAAFAELAAATG